MENVAKRVIHPTKAGVFRTVFLYTGQGESTLLVIPNGPGVDDYLYVLVDCDEDREKDEIDVRAMLADLFEGQQELAAFINTHPHKDHLAGVKNIYDEIGIQEVWHSNHKPSGQHDAAYQELKYVLNKVGKDNEYHLKGTNDPNKLRSVDDEEVTKTLGWVEYIVLSPAEYVCDEIDGEDEETRYRRIHEQSGVIKFSYKGRHLLITGDSDKKAWQDHITDYHGDKLKSDVLSASHHGSRTFFKSGKDDGDPFTEHLAKIDPAYLIISAPKRKDSPHDHPHEDALALYREHVEEENILHLGNEDADPYCVLVDIDQWGNLTVDLDYDLIATYGLGEEKEDSSSGNQSVRKTFHIGVGAGTKLDDKPMGAC